MKKCLAVLLITFISFSSFTTVCAATEMYVKDIDKLNLRAGNGMKYQVIKTLAPDEKVTVLSTAGSWTKINTVNGDVGWVVSKYLTRRKPAHIKIEDLNIQMETLRGQLEQATIENRKLKEENLTLTTRLNENSIQLDNLEKSFNDLKSDSSQYLTLKKEYEQIVMEKTEKDARLRALEDKIKDQYISVAIKWSLTGAGILLIGFILGNRTKRKRSSLL